MSKYKTEINKLYNLRKHNLIYEINQCKSLTFANFDKGLIFNLYFELKIANSNPIKAENQDFKLEMDALDDVFTFLNELECRRSNDNNLLLAEYNTKSINGRPFYLIINIYKFPYCR